MSNQKWGPPQLREIADAEELVLVIARDLRPAQRVPVWPVTVGEHAYVRSYLGVTSGWYRSVIAVPAQKIALTGGDVPVVFEYVPAADAVNRDIDLAFLVKYDTDEYRDYMVQPIAQDATLRILPG